MNDENKKDSTGLIYGETVYWGTIIGAMITIIGSMLAFLGMDDVLDPGFVFSAIWQGKSANVIWLEGSGHLPDAYWYVKQFRNGDAIVMLGILTGVFALIPACFLSAIQLCQKKQRFFSLMACITGFLVLLPSLGLL